MFRRMYQTVAVTLFCLQTVVYAQGQRSGVPYARPDSVPGSPAVLSYGYSSTLQEGLLRGWADWMRGFGEGHRSLGEAACYFQTAQAQLLQNKQAWVELFWHKKQLYRENHGALSPRPARPASPVQEAAHRRPARRTITLFAANGKIKWPVVVRRQESGQAQDQLQSIFARKSTGSDTSVGTVQYRQGKAAIAKIRDDLQKRVRSVPCDEYSAALGLLRELEKEISRSPEAILLTQK